MSKVSLILSLGVLMICSLLTQGCSSELDCGYKIEDSCLINLDKNERIIRLPQAIDIANDIVDSGKTRSWSRSIKDIDYVCTRGNTRNVDFASDTIAYVINYDDNEGFAIISADKTVFPILAYSHEGNFSFENEIAVNNFINNIETYIYRNTDGTIRYPILEDYMELCNVTPKIKCKLGQRSPWDRYVIKEHPGCPVGCVAVAAALSISHTRNYMNYHGEDFFFKSILTALNEEQSEDNNSEILYGTPVVITYPTYDYKTASDRMAKFLYWLGKDLNMQYYQTGSSAFASDVYNLCEDLNILVPSGYANYNQNKITKYLQNNCIVFMEGCDPDNYLSGHSWVCDGSMAIVNKENHSEIYHSYLHCDWGWYGSGNGYFSGEIFSVSGSEYKPLRYFAVSTIRDFNFY